MAEDLICWKASYKLGSDEIDEQLRSPLELINKIWLAIGRSCRA